MVLASVEALAYYSCHPNVPWAWLAVVGCLWVFGMIAGFRNPFMQAAFFIVCGFPFHALGRTLAVVIAGNNDLYQLRLVGVTAAWSGSIPQPGNESGCC
jgi:hypothetical protein